ACATAGWGAASTSIAMVTMAPRWRRARRAGELSARWNMAGPPECPSAIRLHCIVRIDDARNQERGWRDHDSTGEDAGPVGGRDAARGAAGRMRLDAPGCPGLPDGRPAR